MGRPEWPVERRPLPAWSPADLVESLGPGPVALLDGLTWASRRFTLVAWAPAVYTPTLEDALAATEAVRLPPGVPALLGAAVGSLSWNGEARFWVPGGAALFDPVKGRLWIRGTLPEEPKKTASSPAPVRSGPRWPRRARAALTQPAPVPSGPAQSGAGGSFPAQPLWPKEAYCAAVGEAQSLMAAKQLNKVILSVPFEARTELLPLSVYKRLTEGDPPGLRFLLDDGPGRTALIGVSPEPLVTLHGHRAEMHLLAGTRPAGEANERELLASAKDREEHAVAVEQARQDLLSVCLPASVSVEAFMSLERHPGLIHLASDLSALLRPGMTGVDLIRACFPAGTVGGIPRAEAVDLINRLEPVPRDWYAGAVGALLPGGDLELWLIIRSLALKDGTATVRTGAGLVAGSQADLEWQECLNKARRTLAAVGAEVEQSD